MVFTLRAVPALAAGTMSFDFPHSLAVVDVDLAPA